MTRNASIMLAAMAALAVGAGGVALAVTDGTSTPPASTTATTAHGPATTSSVSAADRKSSAPQCVASQLSATVTDAKGAVGHGGEIVVLTNSSSTACSMSGFPIVSLTKSTGSPQTVAVEDASGAGFIFPAESEQPVSLAPDAQASFWIEWVNGSGTNSGALAVGLSEGEGVVIPPNADINGVGKLVVSPIVDGVIDSA